MSFKLEQRALLTCLITAVAWPKSSISEEKNLLLTLPKCAKLHFCLSKLLAKIIQ